MGYRVDILDSAVKDIEELLAYLQRKLGDDVAEKAYIQLMAKLALLETQPDLGSPVQELSQRGYQNFHLLVHNKKTKILYKVDQTLQVIHIHAVFDSRRDFQSLLNKRMKRKYR